MGSKSGAKRDSNFELLRIVAMIMIVASHFALWSVFSGVVPGKPDDVQSVFKTLGYTNTMLGLTMLNLGGKVGVTIFAMISGYFLVNMKFSWKRIRELSLQTSWYTIVVAIFMLAMTGYAMDVVGWLKVLFPVVMGVYWYVTTFIIVLLISPAINLAIKTFDKKDIRAVLIILIVLMGVPKLAMTAKVPVLGLSVGYALGAYVRQFNVEMTKKFSGSLIFAVIVMSTLITGVLMYFSKVSPFLASYRNFFVEGFSINTIALAFLIFMFFKHWNIGHIKFINVIASATFGVYLLHDNPMIRMYIWREIINPADWRGAHLIIGMIFSVLGIFIVGILLDFVRQFMFKTIGKIWSKFKATV